MVKKKCGFGFNCGSMMQQPGLLAEQCPNKSVCGTISDLLPNTEVELYRIRQPIDREQSELVREIFRVNQQQAASYMLRMRGCPQNLESLGILESLVAVENQLRELRTQLAQFEDVYIPPQGCEAHTYNVKRPWGIYPYNKLTSEQAIFEPSEKVRRVKVIHLSKNDDPRNQEARAGIERRNKLMKLSTRLEQISTSLQTVLVDL